MNSEYYKYVTFVIGDDCATRYGLNRCLHQIGHFWVRMIDLVSLSVSTKTGEVLRTTVIRTMRTTMYARRIVVAQSQITAVTVQLLGCVP